MAKICLCLMGRTIAENFSILDRYRPMVDMVELRADCLNPDERLVIRRFPERAGIPAILTMRRECDGGVYAESESSRIVLIARGLAFAEQDSRRNFAYVDLEEDLDVPALEEAARAFGTRIIRSYHNTQGIDADITGHLRRLYRMGDEIAKVAVRTSSLSDVTTLLRAAKAASSIPGDRIIIGMGEAGACTRLLAEKLGSLITYSSPKNALTPAAPGQFSPEDLLHLYRFRSITKDTALYGVTGYPLRATSSPEFFNAVFDWENTDAVYLRFPAKTIESFLELAGELGLRGASVTIPHKETLLAHLAEPSAAVTNIGACNTIVRMPEETGGKRGGKVRWKGFNTDAQGFSASLLDFLGAKNLWGKKVTIIGAGGAARAVAFEVHRLGGKALILNRTAPRAEDVAKPYHFEWSSLDDTGARLARKHFHDVIIQTTSVGMESDTGCDPLENYRFSGSEAVMDLIYKPAETHFLERARKAGCRTRNGYDMLERQARYQFYHFFGRECPTQKA